MLQATTTAWPIAGDAPSLETIVADQAKTISAQEALLHAYQGNLNAAQSPPAGTAATGNGTTTGSSTSVVVTTVTGTIVANAAVTGVGIPTGTTVLGQISGTTGGAGTYLLSTPVNLATAVMLTFTPTGGVSTWPLPGDAPTLQLIVQQQTAILRTQSALLQHYQDLLNTSQTPAPPTGP